MWCLQWCQILSGMIILHYAETWFSVKMLCDVATFWDRGSLEKWVHRLKLLYEHCIIFTMQSYHTFPLLPTIIQLSSIYMVISTTGALIKGSPRKSIQPYPYSFSVVRPAYTKVLTCCDFKVNITLLIILLQKILLQGNCCVMYQYCMENID